MKHLGLMRQLMIGVAIVVWGVIAWALAAGFGLLPGGLVFVGLLAIAMWLKSDAKAKR